MNKRNRVMEIFYRFMSGEHMAVKQKGQISKQ